MQLNEAYTVLGLDSSADENQVKKKYRELSKKFHPDLVVGKDASEQEKNEATKKFQEINQAFETIKNPPQENSFGGFNINDFMGGFSRRSSPRRKVEEIHVHQTLSFKESILGSRVKISYDRDKACDDCSGNGFKHLHSGCRECDGFGRITRQTNMGIMMMQCGKCKPSSKQCDKCKGVCTLKHTVDLNIKIPGGVKDGNIMRLQGAGNFIGDMMGQMIHSDSFLHLKVLTEPGLELIGNDVHSHISISLLEALKGKSETVKTVNGDVVIEIKDVKNKDVFEIPKAGVNGTGKHIVNINVNYPKDCSDLISYLESKENQLINFGPDYDV